MVSKFGHQSPGLVAQPRKQFIANSKVHNMNFICIKHKLFNTIKMPSRDFFFVFFDHSTLLPLSGPNKEISQTLRLELKLKNTSNMPL